MRETYPNFHDQCINNAANHSNEIKCVPWIIEKILKIRKDKLKVVLGYFLQ